MAENNEPTKDQHGPSDWQLFTNNGLFNSVFPPSQRFSSKAKAYYKNYNAVILTVPTHEKRNKSLAPMTAEKLLSKPKKPSPKIENAENFVVIWLHDRNHKMKNYEKSKIQLKQVANSVKIFTNPEECYSFMNAIKDEKIFLIISGETGESLVQKVHDAEQLESIYLLDRDTEYDPMWIEQYPVIRGIYKTILMLCNQLKNDVKMLDYNLVGFEVLQALAASDESKANQQDAVFMYDQLFRDIVLAMNDDNIEDMIEFCQNQYQDNPKEMMFLESIKKGYFSHSAIWWYSQESFLYRILNKALRTHQYDTLYVLRAFTRHLDQQLRDASNNNHYVQQCLFRGQAMEKNEFERIRASEGGLLSIANFFSTSSDREVALKFASQSLNNPKKVSVLMEIMVNQDSAVPVANISQQSQYANEKEWLFSMGSIFRIGSCIRGSDGVWVLNLTTTSDQDEQLKTLRMFLKKSMEDTNSCLNFARLMRQLAAWKKSEYFYLMALQTEQEWQRCAVLYNDLGTVKSEMGENDSALSYYRRSLALREIFEPENKASRATIYNNIATIYYEKSETSEAIKYYQKALEAAETTEERNESLIATLYGNLATILKNQGKLEEALENDKESLKIRLKILPAMHPDIAWGFNSMASTLHQMGSHEQAVEYAQKAVDIDRKVLPPDHPQTLTHLNNLEIFKNKLKNQ